MTFFYNINIQLKCYMMHNSQPRSDPKWPQNSGATSLWLPIDFKAMYLYVIPYDVIINFDVIKPKLIGYFL